MSIVDLESAATHLRVDLDESGDEVVELLELAEGIVFAHIEEDDPETEYAGGLPAGIYAAILLVLLELHDNRDSDPLTTAAMALLRPFRSPGVW